MEKLITIIIPFYERLHYLKTLLYILEKQIDDSIEVIVVDDGSNCKYLDSIHFIKVIHLKENSGGASVPRNVGLDISQGKYIAFIDSDDLVSDDYIKTLKDKINDEKFDYCFISWRYKEHDVIIKDEPPYWNTCVWNCLYKRELIGDKRFNPDIIVGEDKDFNERVRHGKHTNIEKPIYFL